MPHHNKKKKQRNQHPHPPDNQEQNSEQGPIQNGNDNKNNGERQQQQQQQIHISNDDLQQENGQQSGDQNGYQQNQEKSQEQKEKQSKIEQKEIDQIEMKENKDDNFVNIEVLSDEIIKDAVKEIAQYEQYNNGKLEKHKHQTLEYETINSNDSQNTGLKQNVEQQHKEQLEQQNMGLNENKRAKSEEIKKKNDDSGENLNQKGQKKNEEEQTKIVNDIEDLVSNYQSNRGFSFSREYQNNIKRLRAREQLRQQNYYFPQKDINIKVTKAPDNTNNNGQKREKEQQDEKQRNEKFQDNEFDNEGDIQDQEVGDEGKISLNKNNNIFEEISKQNRIDAYKKQKENLKRYYTLPKQVERKDFKIKEYLQVYDLEQSQQQQIQQIQQLQLGEEKLDLQKLIPGESVCKKIDLQNISDKNIIVNIEINWPSNDQNNNQNIAYIKSYEMDNQQDNGNIGEQQTDDENQQQKYKDNQKLQLLIAGHSQTSFRFFFETDKQLKNQKIDLQILFTLEDFPVLQQNQEKKENFELVLPVIGEKIVPIVSCQKALTIEQNLKVIKVACKLSQPQTEIRATFQVQNYNSLLSIDFLDDIPNDYLTIRSRPSQTMVDYGGNCLVNFVMRPNFANIKSKNITKVKKVLLLKFDNNSQLIYSFPILIEIC